MNSQTTYTIDEALNRLRNYCVYQERCHKDVAIKLKEMGMISIAKDEIINSLIQENYLNEERFAKSFVSGKFRIKKWGKQRIVRELKFKDISKYNIEIALKEINDEDYYNSLNELSLKKIGQLKEANLYKKKKKLVNYLLYRGWESNLVYKKVNELLK